MSPTTLLLTVLGRWFALYRVSSDCISIFKQFISDFFPSHRCHKNSGQILAIDI